MSRQYSIDDIAKYKTGSGYDDWIANLNAIGSGPQTGDGVTISRIRFGIPKEVTDFLARNPQLEIYKAFIARVNSTPHRVFFRVINKHRGREKAYIVEKTYNGVKVYRDRANLAFDVQIDILEYLERANVSDLNDLIMRGANPRTWEIDDNYSSDYILSRLLQLDIDIDEELEHFIMADRLDFPTAQSADLTVEDLDLEEGGSGFGLENNISTINKMPKKKFGNTDTQLYEGMLGGSMEEMGLDGMEGEGVFDWLQNLYQNIRDPRGQQKFMPKPIREFNDIYEGYNIVSIDICREPLSKGLQNIIDRASRGDLLKNLAKSPYETLFHLYANVYLKDPKTGKTKSFRVEKNQRVEIFDKIVPPKGGPSGKCMSVPNIPPNLPWGRFWDNTDDNTWIYSANRWNCQAFLKTRLEALGLLTPALKEFIMQDIDTILDPVKNKFQISIAKGITDFASIMQNIYKGGEMEGGMMCNCGSKCGCGQEGGWIESHVHLKQGKYPDITGDNTNTWASDYAGRGKKKQKGGYVAPHKHDPQTWEVQTRYLEPNWWNNNRDYYNL